jgi:cytochrome c
MTKIIISIALAVIVILGINKIADSIYEVKKPEKSAYQITVASQTEENGDSNSSDKPSDIMALLASANASEGEKVFKKCASCHSVSKGGKNKIGPALWGVIGRQAGILSDYKYSKSLISYGKKWSFQEIDGFLAKPKEWVPGTKMAFAGLKNQKDRASLILYMNNQSDQPLPIK